MSKMHYFRNKLSKIITITSPKNITKITSQKIFQFGPLPIKISGYASGLELIIRWSLKKRSWSWKSGLSLSGLGLGFVT